MNLGERLRWARDRKNLKQTQVMRLTGINNKTLSGYENGVSEPDAESLTKLAELYDVSIDYLMGRTNNRRGTPEPSVADNDRDVDEAVDELIRYLDVLGLTNEEIIKRMNFEVDGLPLSEDEADEFIEFVRVKRLMKKRQLASASKPEEL